MAIGTAVVTGTTPKAGDSTTQDYTSSGFGTPDAAIVVWSKSTGAPANDANISIGFITASDDMCIGFFSDDNVGTTLTTRSSYQSKALTDTESNATATGAVITDGIRLVYSAVFADNYNVEVLLIKGLSDVNLVAELLTNSGDNIITSIGFESDLLFVAGVGDSAIDTDTAAGLISFGIVHKNSSDVIDQFCFAFSDIHNQGTSNSERLIQDDFCCLQLYNGGSSYGKAQDFTSTGLNINIISRSGNDYVLILALKLSDPDEVKISLETTPTSTGTETYTTTFNPGSCLFLGGTEAALDTIYNTDTGHFHVGFADGSTQLGCGITTEDNVATSNTSSYISKTKSLEVIGGDQTTVYSGSVSDFGDTGFDINYTDVDATARYFAYVAFKSETEVTEKPIEVYPAIGGTGRVAYVKDNAEYPWWEEFEEPEPGTIEKPEDYKPTNAAIAELAGEIDFDIDKLRTPKTEKVEVQIAPKASVAHRATVEYTSSIKLKNKPKIKMNSVHERWSDQVWQLQQSVAAQNNLIKAILLMKLLD